MEQRFNYDDIEELENYIKKQKKPLFIKSNNVIIAIVLKQSAKIKYINEGYFALTVNELYEFIKNAKTFKEQQKIIKQKVKSFKKHYQLSEKVKDIFQGNYNGFKII